MGFQHRMEERVGQMSWRLGCPLMTQADLGPMPPLWFTPPILSEDHLPACLLSPAHFFSSGVQVSAPFFPSIYSIVSLYSIAFGVKLKKCGEKE